MWNLLKSAIADQGDARENCEEPLKAADTAVAELVSRVGDADECRDIAGDTGTGPVMPPPNPPVVSKVGGPAARG